MPAIRTSPPFIKFLAGPLLLMFGAVVLMLPGVVRLGRTRQTSVDGVVTIEDATAAGRKTGLRGWALVDTIQRLTRRKFAVYTTRNYLDSPDRAFAHGMGYCTQYNLALKEILDGLGFDTRAVFSLKVRDLNDERWTMGHTWLRVTIDGEERDVCAGDAYNVPGRNDFIPLWPVLPGPRPLLLLTHLGVILLGAFVEWKSILSRRPAPYWIYFER